MKTILPITDELNDILGRIFVRNPEERISLPELKRRIMACSAFTQPQGATSSLYTPPVSPEATSSPRSTSGYASTQDCIADDDCDYEYDVPLSPADSETSNGSRSDDGSVFSDDSSPDELLDDDSDDDCYDEIPEIHTPPPVAGGLPPPPIMDAPECRTVPYPGEFAHQYPAHQVPVTHQQPMHMPAPAPPNCHQGPKFSFPYWSDMLMRYVQPAPLQHHQQQHQQHNSFSFHQQMQMFSTIPGF